MESDSFLSPRRAIATPVLPELSPLWQATLGAAAPTPEVRDRFQLLYEGILAGNRQLNLTRITDPEAFWEKHLWDSLRGIAAILNAPASELPTPCRIVDIGTGAGFPGLPIALARPDWQVTLVDSTQKKVRFLNALIDDLAIANGTAIAGRAEKLGRIPPYRGAYDWATVRAVGTPSACARYVFPWLKPGGQAVLYRGRWTEEDRDDLQATLQELGGAIATVDAFETPISHAVRHSVYLQRFYSHQSPVTSHQ
ncbi:16S rRNA (guanine(527)-N(7))-methyltransferase RsmG [Baaleninema simplex]|uniref:16S rRNA (guanine(527)-N(7))-methyltransferase RsmG n=1 Tax=Baaleninema simplex TaxID=2862350 RepID=UPI0003472431|nr:16S rRNA (guanine(527)-N(7))-methyltransferase RsmG [Baaleninema simplex]